jgi:hypothetical protein
MLRRMEPSFATPSDALRYAADLLDTGRHAPTPDERHRAFNEARAIIARVAHSMDAAADPINIVLGR